MKTLKKLLAILLTVCMLVGMPLSIDVSAVRNAALGGSIGFALTQAMVIPDSWGLDVASGKGIALYFTGNVKIDLDTVGAFVTIVNPADGNTNTGAGEVAHNGSEKLYIWQAKLAKLTETGVNDYYVELNGSSGMTVADIMQLRDQKWSGAIVAVRLYEKNALDSTFGELATAKSSADGKGETAETWSIDNKIAGVTDQADGDVLASNRYCHWNGHTFSGTTQGENTRDCIDVAITTEDSADTFKLVSATYDPSVNAMTVAFSHQLCFCYSGDWNTQMNFRAVTADGEVLYTDGNGNYKPETQATDGYTVVGTGYQEALGQDAGNGATQFTVTLTDAAKTKYEACKAAAKAYGQGAYVAFAMEEYGGDAARGEVLHNWLLDTAWTSCGNPTKPMLATHFTGRDRAIVPIIESMAFSKGKLYVMNDIPGAMVRTIEADLYLPTTANYGGGVLGNWVEQDTDEMKLEIGNTGNPILSLRKDNETTVYSYNFDQVNVFTGKWTHLAITIEADQLCCYVNGELVQTISESAPEMVYAMPLCVGGYYWSNRSDYYNDQYFRGRMASLTLYGDVRTAEEVMADTVAVDQKDENLLASYQMDGAESIDDLSANGNDLSYPWIDSTNAGTDYAYTFAVVGDTQNLVRYSADYVDDLYNWIAANAESQKIEFVFGLGDMTDQNIDSEWATVKTGIDILKTAQIPFSMVRGNHDGNTLMNTTFPYSEYGNTTGSTVSGCYDGTYNGNTYQMENYYQELTVGETKYLMLSLEYGAPDGVLAWADKVIASYPDHQVIVTTHNFLDRTGKLNDDIPQNTDEDNWYPSYYGEGANSSQDMWDECISKHQNVVLVMSGHVGCNNIRHTELTGKYGNTVQALMVNPQLLDFKYPVGMVALLHVWEDGKVEVEYYSTVKNQYYNTINQFSFEIGDVAQAAIGETEYADFSSAFNEANSGDTVKLLADVKVEESVLLIPEGVTVDLNGNQLQADNVLAFGHIVDSQQGVGGIEISNDRNKAFVQMQEDNAALPLYDSANGCYRFYDYTFEYKTKEEAGSYNKYALRLALPNQAAYDLLAADANGEMLSVRLLVTKSEEAEVQKLDFTFKDSTIDTYAAYHDTDPETGDAKAQAITLTVYGLDNISYESIQAVAMLQSPTGMANSGTCELPAV